jgi:hypothetical protein
MDDIFQEIELSEGVSSANIIVKLRNYEKKEQYKNSGYKWNPNEKYWYINYWLNVYDFDSRYPNKFDNNTNKFINTIKNDSNIDNDILEVFLKQLFKSIQLIPPVKFICKKQNDKIELNINKPNLSDKMMREYSFIWNNK